MFARLNCDKSDTHVSVFNVFCFEAEIYKDTTDCRFYVVDVLSASHTSPPDDDDA